MHVIDQPSASATAASGGAELTRRTWKMPREMLMVRGAQIAPLFIVALGINTSAKVALASTLVFFIVMSGARAGVRSTDAEWLRLSTVLGANKYQMFLKVLIPVATPAIFAALRLGLIYSLLGVVGSELISARNGLGQLIATYSATFQMEAVYAILLFLAVIAVVLNQVMSHAERRFLRWQPPVDR
ncbi:MAG: ABC transporter permease subunit [Rhodococcus sp. (in: high G+C Gram-positive bacteria)]|nr:MAG: ABC transporter permease subunit [Rhodococcus sp. (in: high G+C Gram-positive bacteria)]